MVRTQEALTRAIAMSLFEGDWHRAVDTADTVMRVLDREGLLARFPSTTYAESKKIVERMKQEETA